MVQATTKDWRNTYPRHFQEEHGFIPLRVEGKIPEDLSGVLYRNGPAIFQNFEMSYDHLFDGDGAVVGTRISKGQAEGAVRIVQSLGLQKERQKGKAIYNGGGYGTSASSLPRFLWQFLRYDLKNVANTNVFCWQDRLFALVESCRPTELSPQTLETIGESDFDKVILQNFTAHPHRVAARKCTYGFGVRMGRKTYLDVYALPDSGEAQRLISLSLPGPTMIHDFIATEKHLLFFVPPLKVSFPTLFKTRGNFQESFQFNADEGTEVIIIPIDDPSRHKRFNVDAFYQWHFANAWEEGEEIVVDFCKYPDFKSNQQIRDLYRVWEDSVPVQSLESPFEGHLWRSRVSMNQSQVTHEERWSHPCEFPRIHPEMEGQETRYIYLASFSTPEQSQITPADQIAVVDMKTGQTSAHNFGEHTYPSEPIYVPKPKAEDENDGWILTQVLDVAQQASFFAVLDAQRIQEEPLAKIWYEHPLPFSFHGNWIPIP